jgi:sulfonate transport system substrate-binding protein
MTRTGRRGAGIVTLLVTVILLVAPLGAGTAAAQAKFTEWGWPLPYEQVSPKSVKWLKDNGYWPVKLGFQTPWMQEATVPIAVDRLGLAKKRGIEVEAVPFLAGPPINAALLSNTIHIGTGGSFPMTSLMDRQAPVKNLCPCWTPLDQFTLIVRPEERARYKNVADLRGKTIGLVSASGSEFVWVLIANYWGLDPYKDVVLKNMTIPDQATFPPGIDVVFPWAFTPRYMMEYRKNGVELEDSGRYQVFFAGTYFRNELLQNAPDAVQAVVDAMVEALLWSRLKPEDATDLVREFPGLKDYPRKLLLDENLIWNNMLKPTSIHFFKDVYPYEGERVAEYLHKNQRIKTAKTAKDYLDFSDTSFMETTFKKLGWRIPRDPPFFKAGYTAAQFRKDLERLRKGEKVLFDFHFPYKMAKPQEFPEPGDLEKRWYFAGKWYEPAR